MPGNNWLRVWTSTFMFAHIHALSVQFQKKYIQNNKKLPSFLALQLIK